MFYRHVDKYLSAFSHGELSNEQASRTSGHLLTCERCRAAHKEIQLGILLAQRLPAVAAPPELSSALEFALRRKGPAPAPHVRRAIARRWLLAIPAAMIVAAAAALIWYQRVRPLISIRPAKT